jgi:membrane protease YdiL (CAAX protease family)
MNLSVHSREPQMSRAGLILALYGALALAAILISAGRDDVDIYRISGVSTNLWLVLSPLLGIAFGLLMVLMSRLSVRRYPWARRLHRDFRSLLGPLSNQEILILAVASAIGEELLFRGALQPWIGLWPQAVIFAALHVGPGARFLPWTVSALVIAVGFGYVFEWTGDLGAPIAAHFTINYLNLHYIANVDLGEEDSGASLSDVVVDRTDDARAEKTA